jgi:hypothetical protein
MRVSTKGIGLVGGRKGKERRRPGIPLVRVSMKGIGSMGGKKGKEQYHMREDTSTRGMWQMVSQLERVCLRMRKGRLFSKENGRKV